MIIILINIFFLQLIAIDHKNLFTKVRSIYTKDRKIIQMCNSNFSKIHTFCQLIMDKKPMISTPMLQICNRSTTNPINFSIIHMMWTTHTYRTINNLTYIQQKIDPIRYSLQNLMVIKISLSIILLLVVQSSFKMKLNLQKTEPGKERRGLDVVAFQCTILLAVVNITVFVHAVTQSKLLISVVIAIIMTAFAALLIHFAKYAVCRSSFANVCSNAASICLCVCSQTV